MGARRFWAASAPFLPLFAVRKPAILASVQLLTIHCHSLERLLCQSVPPMQNWQSPPCPCRFPVSTFQQKGDYQELVRALTGWEDKSLRLKMFSSAGLQDNAHQTTLVQPGFWIISKSNSHNLSHHLALAMRLTASQLPSSLLPLWSSLQHCSWWGQVVSTWLPI